MLSQGNEKAARIKLWFRCVYFRQWRLGIRIEERSVSFSGHRDHQFDAGWNAVPLGEMTMIGTGFKDQVHRN